MSKQFTHLAPFYPPVQLLGKRFSLEWARPFGVNHPMKGLAKKLEYFFPSAEGGEDHQGFLTLVNGDPPRVIVTRDRKTVVREEVKK